jgi:hypothetical protein
MRVGAGLNEVQQAVEDTDRSSRACASPMIVESHHVSKRVGRPGTEDQLSCVPEGSVFALIGANGT